MICYKCLNTVEPEKCIYGLHKACFREWFQLQNLSEFEKIRAKASSFENNPKAFFSSINLSFYQGKFKKYSASLDNQQYILKVEEKDYPELPAIESIRKIIIYNFNMLYKKLNLSISSQFGESHISMFRFF